MLEACLVFLGNRIQNRMILVRAHEAKASMARWQQEVGRPTLSQFQRDS